MVALRRRCAPAAADGPLEIDEITKKCDDAVGREQHGSPHANELPL
jgi:hypothetical protein